MRLKIGIPVLAVIAVMTTSGCSSGSVPASPSMLSQQTAQVAAGGRFRTLDDPPATPMAVIISIVSSFGSGAFMPNPTLANMGDQIVFTNTDAVLHHIVLDDGTDLGDVAPGQSSAPVALATPTATFHCTIHPSMVGSINGDLPAPAPDPYYPMPPDDYYGYY